MSVRWISLAVVKAIHDEQLASHGGLPGLRDAGALESALARPQNLMAYGAPDLPALAAAYAYGIARNHPFSDGNKRTAFVVAATFLLLNGQRFTAPESDVVLTILALADGSIEEEALADWFRHHCAASGA